MGEEQVSEAKFTRGPWSVGGDGGFIKTIKNQLQIQPTIGCAYGAGDEVKANAHLIAAAPDLYNALEAAIEWVESSSHGDNCFLHDSGEYNRCFCGKDSLENYIDQILAKARGES
jgi:hypothetical protein